MHPEGTGRIGLPQKVLEGWVRDPAPRDFEIPITYMEDSMYAKAAAATENTSPQFLSLQDMQHPNTLAGFPKPLR